LLARHSKLAARLNISSMILSRSQHPPGLDSRVVRNIDQCYKYALRPSVPATVMSFSFFAGSCLSCNCGCRNYGQFLITIDGAPLAIALGWATVIYYIMAFSDHIELPEPTRPILDGLLALSVDFGMDVIVVRLGLWVWTGVGQEQQWFGVPWANFGAWFIIVWSFSSFLRAFRLWKQYPVRRWLYPPAAVLLSVLVLVLTSEVSRFMTGPGALSILVLVVGSLVIVLASHPRALRITNPDTIAIGVPLTIHAFALFAGIRLGIFSRQPALGAVGAAMIVISVVVHLLPWWLTRSRSLPFE
jgi:hypothetical protein